MNWYDRDLEDLRELIAKLADPWALAGLVGVIAVLAIVVLV